MERKSDPRKQTIYFPNEMLEEIRHEAKRQERPLSWIIQRAWNIARDRVAPPPPPSSRRRDH
jgi:uncharacterized small protein (TIGR04563 family)